MQNGNNSLFASFPRPIIVNTHFDLRGSLSFCELEGQIPFITRRMYYSTTVDDSVVRGKHAHRELQQVMFSIRGNFKLDIFDGNTWSNYTLKENHNGIFIPSGMWRELSNFSSGAVCLVLASMEFNAKDYIHTIEEYVKWVENK
jgi:dTDP-4-dehydrorhamnose 3,5-epimerase-like enzyme